MSYDQIRELSKRRSYSRKDSKAVLKTRAASAVAEERKRAITEERAMDTLVTVTERRGRESVDAPENSGESLRSQETRCRVGDPHLASVAERGRSERSRPVAES